MRIHLLLFMFFLLGCIPLQPPPTLNPLPPPDAGPPDIFTGYIADCSDSSVGSQSAKVGSWVQSCPNFNGGYDACMVKGVNTYTKDAIVCVTIDLNVGWQQEIAKGTASDQQKVNAKCANTWIRDHRLGARR